MENYQPVLSVIIPAYNEETFIYNTLTRLFDVVGESFTFEVVVVNNGSTDSTETIVKGFDNIKLINLKERTTIAKARNIGVSIATSKIIAFIDADVLITKEWVEQVMLDLPLLESAPLHVTGALYDLSEQSSRVEESWFGHLIKKKPTYLNGGNIITTRKLLDTVGGFKEDMITGEDVDFCERAQIKGAKLIIHNGYKTHHEGYPKNVKDFFKRELWHGMGDMQSIQSFLNSKVAIASVINSCLLSLCIVSLMLSNYPMAIGMGLLSIILNIALTLYKFGLISPRFLCVNILYHFVYLLARSLSYFKR
jgi:glycosyltransferase involved in cell wall biosynthesis